MNNSGINKRYYNWYAGNHCAPKCSLEKVERCKREIEKLIKNLKLNSRKEFVDLIRREKKICNLSAAEYRRSVYTEPVCTCASEYKMSLREKKICLIMEEFTLLLMWLSRFSDQKFQDEPIWRAWKGYDFDVLNILLKKGYISFSYKSKGVMFRDEGIKKIKKLLKKYGFDRESLEKHD